MRIGFIDLDTTHPAAWISIERALGHEVVGVWDGGTVHPAGYAERFAAEHKVPRVFSSLDEMIPEVDAVILHGCDWDLHVERARPFVEAGKAVLVDKPMAGKLADLRQLQAWARSGVKIFGGSSLRYARELVAWKNKPVAERGTPHTVLSGCAVDEFNYGIHAYSFLCSAMGPGAVSARYLGDGPQQRVEVRWPDGRVGWVIVGAQSGGWMPFYGTIVTERGVTQMQPAVDQLYAAFLEVALPWLSGQGAEPPCPFDELIEPELVALAALQSRQDGGAEVQLTAIRDDVRHDGAAFAVSYRNTRYSTTR